MKFLLVPNSRGNSEIANLFLLKNGLVRLGHEVDVCPQPLIPHRLFPEYGTSYSQIKKISEKKIYQGLNYDVVFETNRARPISLKKGIVHVNWVQDFWPDEFESITQDFPKSLLYLYGSPKIFGFSRIVGVKVKTLLSGYQSQATNGDGNKRYDLNLLGYIPDYSEIFDESPGASKKYLLSGKCDKLFMVILREVFRKPGLILQFFNRRSKIYLKPFFFTKEFKNLVGIIESRYMPLSGFLDYNMKPDCLSIIEKKIWQKIFSELPRYLDRICLFREFQKLPSSIIRIIAGPNWKAMFPDVDFVTVPQNEVEIFSTSKLTVHNSTHGLGLHPRVFGCIACGSFPLMHKTPFQNETGSLETVLEPGRHFGIYTKQSFQDVAQKWCKDVRQRQKGVQEAQKIMEEHHSWDQRARQILVDVQNI